MTTNRAFYGAPEAAPSLYMEVLRHTTQEAAPNLSLTSQWGDSLSKGDQAVWRRQLATAYRRDNEEVWGSAAAPAALDSAGAADKFYSLARQMRVYYGALLKDAPQSQVDHWLRTSDEPSRKLMLSVLADLAVECNTTNDKGFNFSTTYGADYVPLRPSSAHGERALEAVLNQGTARVLDWFRRNRPAEAARVAAAAAAAAMAAGQGLDPPPPGTGLESMGQEVTLGLESPSQGLESLAPAAAAAAEGAPGRPPPPPAQPKEDDKKKALYVSQVPMKWNLTEEPGEKTSYRVFHGGLGSVNRLRAAAMPPGRGVTSDSIAPFGKVLGAEAVSVKVPAGFTTVGLSTSFRAPGFIIPPLDTPEARVVYLARAREAAENIFASRERKNLSFVPLGSKGLQHIDRYNTEYSDMVNYGPEITARARSQRPDIRAICTAPTAQPTPVLGNVQWVERTLRAHRAASARA